MKKLLLFIFVFVIAMTMSPIEGYGQEIYTGLVSIDSVDAEPGESSSFDISLSNNNLPLSGYLIPIQIGSSDIVIDSISFANSVMGNGFDYFVQYPESDRYYLYCITKFDSSQVNSYSGEGGILATFHFTVSASATSQTVAVDSVFLRTLVGNNTVVVDQINFADSNSDSARGSTYPDFKPGIINIQIATAIDDESDLGLPTEFSLTQNFPNPFNPTTTIEFTLPKSSNVKLVVFNVLGQKVSSLIDEFMPAGVHSVEFDGKNNPSGIYFYRLEHEKGAETKKMVMIK